jgi:signal transduction protein with GAF and PtsI domain
LQGIVEAINGMMKVEVSLLLLSDEQDESLVFRSAAGRKSDKIKGFDIKIGEGVVGQAAKDHKPIIVNGASQNDPHLRFIWQELGYETPNILSVPLIVRGRLIGVIEVINRTDGNPFTESDVLLLSIIASQFSVPIDYAHFFKRVEGRIAELTKLIEAELLNQLYFRPYSFPL